MDFIRSLMIEICSSTQPMAERTRPPSTLRTSAGSPKPVIRPAARETSDSVSTPPPTQTASLATA